MTLQGLFLKIFYMENTFQQAIIYTIKASYIADNYPSTSDNYADIRNLRPERPSKDDMFLNVHSLL